VVVAARGVAEMDQILRFVVEHMGFLWVGARFRIADSEVTTINGGNAFLVLESSAIRVRVVRDRGQLILEMQSRFATGTRWIGGEIVYRLLRGAKPSSDLLDEDLAAFLGTDLEAIEDVFGVGQWQATYLKAKEIERARSRELWHPIGQAGLM